MDPDLMQIGDAATVLGVSVDTLRRWDESGRFSSIRNTPAGYRYYSKKAVKIYLSDLLKLATDWISSGEEIPAHFYCKDSSIFQARLSKMQDQLGAVGSLHRAEKERAGSLGRNRRRRNAHAPAAAAAETEPFGVLGTALGTFHHRVPSRSGTP